MTDGISDAALIEATAAVVARPKAEPADSFVLHAPLELLARAALLTHVSPAARRSARLRIAGLAAAFQAAGPPAPASSRDFDSTDDAVAALRRSLASGDVDGAGAAGSWLGRNVDATHLVAAVGDAIVPSLAAAAHGPIHLHLLGRAAPRSPSAGATFANLARELARNPSWSLSWMDGVERRSGDIVGSLAGIPVLGPPGSTFIQPLMDQAERSGLADDALRGAIGPDVDIRAATISLIRVATASMLLDDPEHAPYGWTHCLTIPQAMAAIAPSLPRPDRAVAVAATHVVGFRAGLGSAPLGALDGPVGPMGPDGLVAKPPHVDDVQLQDVIDFAASHPDAHLAKYTLACLDAARTDPTGAAQHLAAAAHLADWWRSRTGNCGAPSNLC